VAHDNTVDLVLFLVPMALAVIFLVWVLWNFIKAEGEL
jgi:hypothetical protein